MPAKIYHGKKRVNMKLVNTGDKVFVDPPGRVGSVQCAVSKIETVKGKTTIYFIEAANVPNQFTGNNRQKSITHIDWYPSNQ